MDRLDCWEDALASIYMWTSLRFRFYPHMQIQFWKLTKQIELTSFTRFAGQTTCGSHKGLDFNRICRSYSTFPNTTIKIDRHHYRIRALTKLSMSTAQTYIC